MKTINAITYKNLNSRQKENYNFHKVASILATYGYNSIRLTDDWKRADFIAIHIDDSYIKVQLKGRLVVARKYLDKDLYIAFLCKENSNSCYLYPHDTVYKILEPKHKNSLSWKRGKYSYNSLTKDMKKYLQQYLISIDKKTLKAIKI